MCFVSLTDSHILEKGWYTLFMEKTFEQWMEEVNVALVSMCGMGSEDLPDWNYWDAWDDGISPKSAAADVLEEAEYY